MSRPDQATRMAGLRLDTNEGAFSKRDNGTTIVPGDPRASLVYQRITHDNEVLRMPPAHSKKELTVEQIDVLRRWIEEGASWDQHWAFVPLEKPEPPKAGNTGWARNPLDRFILDRLEQEGLAPAPEADKRTLARRAALDLTGLPPDPGVLESFLSDTSENAYEKLVDKLLLSKHWGEHRGRYWLDAARYGDTHGIHIDNYREMWAYRDWVIQAFNDNKPFDEFTVEQIAGDLLPNPTLDQFVATGFQRCNMTTNEGGVIPEEYEVIYAKDRADTTGMVFLGLTVGCATCHDHKFDPIAQRDFYSLTAFFRNTTQFVMDGNVSDPPPVLVVPAEDDRDEWNKLRTMAAETDAALERLVSSVNGVDAVDEDFTAWLESGEYRSIKSPLEASAEAMKLSLNGKPEIERGERRDAVSLHADTSRGKGPDKDTPALLFGEDSWAESPPLDLDGDKAFSITMWVYHPNDAGSFIVAGQDDPDDGNRGWTFAISERQLSFKMTGDKLEGDDGRSSVLIIPNNLRRLPAAEWTHVTVTHDGSGERAGLRFYMNGEIIPVQGSEYFTKVEGSVRVDRPFLLGKGVNRGRGGRGEIQTRYMNGGGIADLRVFNRPISVQEAKVVSQWSVLKRASAKRPKKLTSKERDALRLYYLARVHKQYQTLMARKAEIESSWRELRRRGGVTHVMQEVLDKEPEAHILNRGMYDQRKVAGQGQHTARLAPHGRFASPQPAGPGQVDCRRRQPAHRARHRQPLLAASFRDGTCQHQRRLRLPGRTAVPSRVARLACGAVPRVGLGCQGLFPHAGDLRDVPPVVGDQRGQDREGCGKPPAVPRSPFPHGRRNGSRLRLGRQRFAGTQDWRSEREALSTGGRLGRCRHALQQHPQLQARHG